MLTKEQIERYSRHILLREIGVKGQQKLLSSKVLLIGAGGLGSPAALYLAAAGVGTLGIVDFDRVNLSDLQRQILHTQKDLNKPKVNSAREKLSAINPDIKVIVYDERLTSKNVLDIIKDYDLVLDCSDNFPTRYLVNDACVLLKKPNVHGSVLRFEGQVTVFMPNDGPCYRCLYPAPPPPGAVPSCAEAGVLGVLPGLIGSIQATEAIKILLNQGRSLKGRLLIYDALNLEFSEVRIKRDSNCPVCGDQPKIKELIDYEQFCNTFAR